MARHARIIVPGHPHHITQRGQRKMPVFFKDEDYQLYLDLLSEFSQKYHVSIWSYCLMPNHIHLIAVPQNEASLASMMAQIHKRYSTAINKREKWTGTLWQGRYYSYVMDKEHARSAMRYVAFNPVSAGLVKTPWEYRWSNTYNNAHDKALQEVCGTYEEWVAYLRQAEATLTEKQEEIKKHLSSGLPFGSDDFISDLEKKRKQVLRPARRGRPWPAQQQNNHKFK